MNSQNIEKPRVLKETKNKIRVEFERTPLLERLKVKFISMHFLVSLIWYIFRLILLIGISYIILYPFYTKIAGSFMIPDDFVNVTVRLIPTQLTLNTYKRFLLRWNTQGVCQHSFAVGYSRHNTDLCLLLYWVRACQIQVQGREDPLAAGYFNPDCTSPDTPALAFHELQIL